MAYVGTVMGVGISQIPSNHVRIAKEVETKRPGRRLPHQENSSPSSSRAEDTLLPDGRYRRVFPISDYSSRSAPFPP